MARQSEPPDLTSLGFGDEIDEVLRGANPNPTRQGCPPHNVLVDLSRRAKPIGDPAYEHLLECSPCYGEVRDMQWAQAMASHSRPRPSWWMASVAAVAFAAICVWLLTSNQRPAGPRLLVRRRRGLPFCRRRPAPRKR